MQSYARDAKNIFIASGVSAMAGLGIQACLAWYLLPEGRGQYAACILFATLLSFSCAMGQEMANVYFVGSKKISVSGAMTQSVMFATLASMTACLAGYALTCTTFEFLNKAPIELFRISLIGIPATIFYLYFTQLYLGMGSVKSYTLLTAAPRAIALIALVVAYFVHLDVRIAILIHAGSEGLVAIVALFHLRIRHAARFVMPTLVQLRQSLSYGLRYYFGRLASMTNVQMGTIVLALSPVLVSELGLFAAASTLAARLWMVAEALQTALLPRASADPSGKSKAVAQCVRLCWPVTMVVVLIVFILSKPLIAFVLSPKFLPVLLPFQILLIGVVIRVIPKILAAYFNGVGRPGINSIAIGSAVLTNVVLIYFFLPLWGLVGVSISMSIAYTVEALILIVIFMKVSKTPMGILLVPTIEDIQKLMQTSRRLLTKKPANSPTTVESDT